MGGLLWGIAGLFLWLGTAAADPVSVGVFPTKVLGAGLHTTVNATPSQLAYRRLIKFANDQTVYLDCDRGDDAGDGSEAKPYRTPDKAIREALASIVMVSGTCPPFDFRATDPAGQVLKHLKAHGPVTFRVPAPALDWRSDGTVSLAISPAEPHRVLVTGLSDRWGYPDRLPRRTLAELRKTGFGWAWQDRVLYTAGAEPYLTRPLFLGHGGTSRVLIRGANIIFDGDFTFDGVSLLGLAFEYEGQFRSPQIFMSGATIRFAPDHNILTMGGTIYTSGVISHAAQNDNMNCRPWEGLKSLSLSHNDTSTGAGDLSTFAPVGNRNPSSAEPGCDSAIFGGIREGGDGPGIADVSEHGSPDWSWIVGVQIKGGVIIARDREAWIESSTLRGPEPLQVLLGATVHLRDWH